MGSDRKAAVEPLPECASRQGGVFTRAQAVGEGWSPRMVKRRVSTGRWVRVAGDGLARPAPNWTAFQLAMAASLTWPGCVASHLTAATLHRWPVPADQLAHVITHRGRRSGRVIRVHAVRLDPDEVRAIAGGVLVTTTARTAVDCLSTLRLDDSLDLYAWLTSRALINHADLAEAAHARARRRGTPTLRALVGLTRTGAVSGVEHRLHRLLQQAGIHGWAAGQVVRDRCGIIGVVDLLFPGQRVVIEVDGWRSHCSAQAFRADRRRQNRLVTAGFVVLRFTWDDLVHHPARVLEEIRTTLLRASV